MWLQVQLGPERFNKGFTILEMIAGAVIVIMVLSMVLAGYKTRIDKANLEKSVDEMMSLAQASLDYYSSRGRWPVTTGDLIPGYMYKRVSVSPFGSEYQINGLNNAVTISMTAPSGLAENYYQGTLLGILPGNGQDTIEITQVMPDQFRGRLEYEKKFIYQQ